ncbi:chemotaxis protein CheB [Paraburkholderia sp. BR13444]|uniref:chemotaxis protein CheB n=1 Tax=Paraburkholderia sp. BR13444 TaxID=3236997 RepID=UPI0034CD426C
MNMKASTAMPIMQGVVYGAAAGLQASGGFMDERDIVVIAGSRGAFSVLKTLADGLPPELPAAVCVVLHIGLHETRLPALLSAWGALPASHPADGEPLARGRIYVAPPGRHMLVSDGKLCVNNGAAENFARPAADPLFRSAARDHGRGVVGALRAAGADVLTDARQLARHIVDAVNGAPARPRKEVIDMCPDNLDLEQELARRQIVRPEDMDRIGDRSALTCPECGGALWRMHGEYPLRYRCHTGHAFGALSLEDGDKKAAENPLWAAIRAVNERIILAHERQHWARRVGDQQQAQIEQARVDEAEKLVQTLKAAISGAISNTG